MFYSWKLNFVLFLSHFLVNISTDQWSNWQSCFNAVSQRRSNADEHMSFNFNSQPNINVETTLGHWHWIDVILSMLFQRCFVNVETTSTNIRRFNFQFQPNFNVETTLVHRRWINVILSTLLQRCFANVETTSINVRRLNFHFQPNINLETIFNVDVFPGMFPVVSRSDVHFWPLIFWVPDRAPRKKFVQPWIETINLESLVFQNRQLNCAHSISDIKLWSSVVIFGVEHFLILYYQNDLL